MLTTPLLSAGPPIAAVGAVFLSGYLSDKYNCRATLTTAGFLTISFGCALLLGLRDQWGKILPLEKLELAR